MGKRVKYTAEQREERQAADEAIREAGETMLADADALGAAVDGAARTVCARLLSYSLRNIALLYTQGSERGITITDIDGYRGWRARGRYPNQPGLRIVAYKGQEDGEAERDSPAGADQWIEPGGLPHEETAPARHRFRMAPVWDISQTTEMDDFEGEPADPEPAGDPAGMLWDNLTEQAARIGYTVTTGGTDPSENDAPTIAIERPRDAVQLARALGPLLSAHTADRKATTAAAVQADRQAEADGSRLRLDLGEYGHATARVEADHDTARVHYTVAGARVNGTFTLSPGRMGEDGKRLESLNVDYGRASGEHAFLQQQKERPNRPEVNGIRLIGGTVFAVASLENLGKYHVYARREGGGTVPARTADRIAAVLRTIAADFLARPDLAQILSTADRLAAARRLADELQKARQLEQRIAELEAEREDRRASVQAWAARAGTVQLGLFDNDEPPHVASKV